MPSLEAVEDLAVRVRARTLSRLHQRSEPSRQSLPEPRLDVGVLRHWYKHSLVRDPAIETLVVEALVDDSTHSARTNWEKDWNATSIILGHEESVSVRGLFSTVSLDTARARRAALQEAADCTARDHRAVARAWVSSFRTVAQTLECAPAEKLLTLLGMGDVRVLRAASERVLALTDDAFAELDGWVRGQYDFVRTGELSWADRVRTLSLERVSALVPLADRVGISLRWLSRVGLGGVGERVADRAKTSVRHATGLRAVCVRPGERVLIVGAVPATATAIAEWMSVVGEAMALSLAEEPNTAARLGVDRGHRAVARSLSSTLLCERLFLLREAGVDGGRLGQSTLEFVHYALAMARHDAVRALFVLDVLSQAEDLPGRMRAHFHRAWGAAPAPEWAVHLAGMWLDDDRLAAPVGLLCASRWAVHLRDRFDEDWFRNPRSGHALKFALERMRAMGLSRWNPDERADVAVEKPEGASDFATLVAKLSAPSEPSSLLLMPDSVATVPSAPELPLDTPILDDAGLRVRIDDWVRAARR